MAADCASYYDTISGRCACEPTFPIFADGTGLISGATPMNQQTHPQMCGLTPSLEIISCYSGHGGYEDALADIKTHAGL